NFTMNDVSKGDNAGGAGCDDPHVRICERPMQLRMGLLDLPAAAICRRSFLSHISGGRRIFCKVQEEGSDPSCAVFANAYVNGQPMCSIFPRTSSSIFRGSR